MKLHLPLTLLTAVLAAVIALPAQAVDAPEGYTTTYLNSPGTLENYSSLTAEDYMAFILQSSQEFTPTGADYWTSSTPLISGGNVFFGSDDADSPVALSFKGGKGSAFYGQSALTFDTLSSLIFSSITGNSAAIYLADGGSLTISNVNDGQSETVDVLFKDIKTTNTTSSFTYGGAIGADYVAISHNGDVSFSGNSSSCPYWPYGGAIYADNDVTISHNGDVSFSGNSAYSGGAIYADNDVTISHNVDVSFSGNTARSKGGAIYAVNDVTISNNGDVSFSSSNDGGAIYAYNKLTISNNGDILFSKNSGLDSGSASYGGAIYTESVTISHNGNVSFLGNYAANPGDYVNSHSDGGAIYADNDVTISNNGDVSFSGNYVNTSSDEATTSNSANGGAIYAREGLTISNNGDVSFSDNYAINTSVVDAALGSRVRGGAIYAYTGDVTISNNGDVSFSGNYASGVDSKGGAIYASDGVTISQNGEVSFSGNNANDHGGAIYASDGVTISQNGDVSFSDNSSDGDGGAIYTDYSDVTISQNGNVYFSDNVASTHGGGAINAYYGGVTISQNGEVSFSGNNANDHGGAIWATHDITVSQNGDVSFSGNSSSHRLSSSYGGAICSESGDVTISHNDDVSFSGNSTAPTATSSYGGAIYAFRVVTLSDNGDVSFSGNSSTRGGAIYARGSLSIQGNDSVLFEKNYKKDGEYCLLSIYSTSDMTLSAKTGGNITFYDSVYSSGPTYLNSDYTDADGNTQNAKGDIIFSGKYAEQHLNEILAANNENRTATDAEILASRTSLVYAMTNLCGGRLRIEDGAIYKGQGLTVSSSTSGENNPTVLLKNGEMNHAGHTITLNAGTRLELSGINTISAANMRLNDGAGFVFNVDSTHLTTAALSYTGALTLGGELVICINSKEGLINGNTYKLMTVTGTSTTEAISWGSTNITIQEGDGLEVVSDDLIWQDNVLYLNYSGTTTYGYTWLGGKKAVWQTDNETLWMNALGDKVVYRDGAQVTFTQDTIEIVGEVQPSSITLAPVKSLTFKTKYNKKAGEWSGSIGGEGISVTIAGGAKGKVTMNDGNTYTGITSIESGTVNVGGSMSFGKSSIVISGGTLDLKSKSVANEIELTGSATIKGGKKYLGTYSQTGGELMKGSVLNVAESAILTDGVVNGTLSGEGSVTVVGDVELGTTGKITTDKLLVDGTLSVSNKGLAMNTKTSSITVEAGGQLISEGALKSAALTVDGGLLELHSAKASSIAITNNMRLRNGADVTAFANVKAANLLMTGAQLTLGQTESDIRGESPSIALSLNAKGNVVLTSSALTLSGKISTGNLTVTGSYVNMTSGKLQTIAVKNTLTLSGDNSFIFDFDAKDGKSYKLFAFKYFISDGTALHELLGWEANESYTLTANAKNITLTVNNAEAWEAYMDTLANGEAVATLSEDDELVESAGSFVLARPAAAVDPMLGKVADTLVQSTWGTAGASRAFGDTIAARGTHATALADGKAAAWISTMGGSSRISSDCGHAGADYTLTGAAFGMEASLSEKTTVGMAIGNSWGKVSTFSAFPVDQDSTHQGIYGKHLLGSSTTLSWMAAHTRTESDGKLAGMACDWTQDALQLDARVDKLFAISDRTTVSAFAGMQYLATDKGECNGLSTGSLQNLRGEIGVSAAHKATDRTHVYGELSFIGDMVRHNPTATVGDYRSRGANPGRAGLNLSVGASYQLNDSWSLNGSYSLELMQNQTSHSANVGATYSF